jgi:hypothetical protein
MDAGVEAAGRQVGLVGLRVVGGICPDVAHGFGFRQETEPLKPILMGPVDGDPTSDQPVTLIEADVVPAAEGYTLRCRSASRRPRQAWPSAT